MICSELRTICRFKGAWISVWKKGISGYESIKACLQCYCIIYFVGRTSEAIRYIWHGRATDAIPLHQLYYEILVLTHFLNNCIHMFYLSINKTGFDAKMQQWRQVLVLKMKMESFHIFLCSTHYLNVFNKVVFQIVHKFLAGERVFHLLSHFWVGNKDGQHFRHMRKDTCKCNKVVKKSFKKTISGEY